MLSLLGLGPQPVCRYADVQGGCAPRGSALERTLKRLVHHGRCAGAAVRFRLPRSRRAISTCRRS